MKPFINNVIVKVVFDKATFAASVDHFLASISFFPIVLGLN
jgi:hypothetical protein